MIATSNAGVRCCDGRLCAAFSAPSRLQIPRQRYVLVSSPAQAKLVLPADTYTRVLQGRHADKAVLKCVSERLA